MHTSFEIMRRRCASAQAYALAARAAQLGRHEMSELFEARAALEERKIAELERSIVETEVQHEGK